MIPKPPWKCVVTSHHYYDFRITGQNALLGCFTPENAREMALAIENIPDMILALKSIGEGCNLNRICEHFEDDPIAKAEFKIMQDLCIDVLKKAGVIT